MIHQHPEADAVERKKFKDTYRIETTRLRGYDYASAGWYHVVLCTKDRVCCLGEVRGGIVGLSDVGCTAYQFCAEIPGHFDRAVIDAFVVMPNHVHAIIGLTSDPARRKGKNDRNTNRRDARSRVSTTETKSTGGANKFGPLKPGSLQAIVHAYKGAVTRWARANGYPFAWQPRFYDRVIRNDRELHAARRYVLENPLKWHLDRNHPDNLL